MNRLSLTRLIHSPLNNLKALATGLLFVAHPTLAEPQETELQETTTDKALIERLEGQDFESLLDTPVALNPDWEVGTPTKINQKSSRTPASVIVISKEQIQWYGYTSVAEVISHISGFSATDDLVQSSFGIRGIHPGVRAGNRSFKVMLDNQPVNFGPNDSNFIDRNLIPISLIERVEVVKGPVSALYGANAFLGVINIVSKNSEEFIHKGNLATLEVERIDDAGNGFFTELSGGSRLYGWDSTYGLAFGYADRSGLTLPLSSPQYQQFADGDANGNGGRVLSSQQDSSKPLTFYLKSRYLADDSSRWQVALHYQELHSDNVFADLNALQTSGNSVVDLYNSFVRLDHDRQLNQQLGLKFDLSFKKAAPLSNDRIELGSDVFYYQRDVSYESIDLGAELNWQTNSWGQFLFGFDFSNDEHKPQSFSRVEKRDGLVTPLTESTSIDQDNTGLYLQWLSQWASDFETIVGYRHDHNNSYNSRDSFRLGLVYSLAEHHSLKLLYGSSFQAPSVELLHRRPVQRGDVIGNPDLAPQVAKTLELIAAGTLGDNIRYSATLYQSQVDDLVVYRDDVNNLSAVNAASADTKGLELDISYDTDSFNVYFNAGWQDIEVSDHSLFVLENRPEGELFPELTANLGVSYIGFNGVRLSLDNQYNGKRPASSSNVIAAEAFYDLDSYFETTLTLQGGGKWFGDKASTIKFQVHDLWDGQHSNPGFGGVDIPGLGLRYSLSFGQRF